MKIKGFLLGTLSVFAFAGAFAQSEVEYDDMYFNSEDRANLKAQRAMELAYRTPEKVSNRIEDIDDGINPTDSYSAREVNPEYTSRAQSQSAQAEEDDYFVANYQYNRNQLNNWNSSYSNWYNNPWYRATYFGPGIDTWNSRYYGYNRWNSPWYDPYWSYNGWSSSFAYHYGPTWNYGWGGYYDFWNRPYFGWNPYYSLGGWYGSSYWNNYYSPGWIVVINGKEPSGRGVVYGKRPTRGSALVSDRNTVRTRTNIRHSTHDDFNSGRVSNSGRQADYYNRSRSTSTSTFHNRGTTEQNRVRPSWSNSSNDRYNSGGRSYTTPSTPSRSYTPSTSSPSRSMGSGSSGRTRGRN